MYRRQVTNAAGQSVQVEANPQMIYNPTIVPSGAQASVVTPADDYIAIEVDTSALNVAARVVLFDGGEGYQLSTGYVMPAGVGITGLSGASYQFILNDLVHANSNFNMIQMSVFKTTNPATSQEIALSQYARQLSLYESSKGGETRLIATINPRKGIHEGQFQLNINTFMQELTVNHRRALVYFQEPGIRLVWGFYQNAELGRTV